MAIARSDTPTRSELLARAAALVPALAARARHTEMLRRIPDETIADLHAADLWRILRPPRFGGYLADLGTFLDIIVELGRGCGSTAWVYSNLASHNWMLAMWPPEAQERVWGPDPEALIGSTLIFPAGRLAPDRDGFRFSGRWPYASGVEASQWIMLGAMLDVGGRPSPRIVVVPVEAITIHDTWHVAGLAGTGSHDVSCDDVFVPACMVFDPMDAREGFAPHTLGLAGDAYRLPIFPLIPHLVATPMIGMARGAYDDVVSRLATQVSNYNRSRVGEHLTVQTKIAEASLLIDTAHLLVRESIAAAHRYVAAGERPPLIDRARWRRDGTHAAVSCVRAVDLLLGLGGATAHFLDNPMQQRFRDIHAAAAQIHLQWDINAPEYGRVAIGLAPLSPIL